MATRSDMLTVDADGHVLEPRDMWQKYLEPKQRERRDPHREGRRGRRGAAGRRARSHLALRGTLGALGGIEHGRDGPDDRRPAQLRGRLPAGRLRPRGAPRGDGRRADRRRAALPDDRHLLGGAGERPEARDRVHAAPTTAGSSTSAATTGAAWCRSRTSACIDPEGAVEEVKRARKDGCAGVYLSPDPPARGGRQFDDPSSCRSGRRCRTSTCRSRSTSWRAQSGMLARLARRRDRIASARTVFAFTFLALDVMAAFTSMMTRGMFESYPRLRCAVLEAGSNWITAWLDRMDHKFEVMRAFIADEAAALGVLQAPVRDLGRARRVA